MAQIVNKLKANIYNYLVSRYESRLSYKKELLDIKEDEYQGKAESLIQKLQLKLDHQLAQFEIKAGIQSDYVLDLIEEKKSQIKKTYDIKEKVLGQKIKRANDNEEKLKSLKAKLKMLKEKRKSALKKVDDQYIIKNPSDTDLSMYQKESERLSQLKADGVNYIQDKYNKKAQALKEKTALDVKDYQEKIDHYSKILMSVEKSLKESQNTVVLEDDVVLSLRNLSMHFGGLKAVDGLTFDVKKGEIFGLIGPNGAGKTTVFNCITRFYAPTAGDMFFQNINQKTVDLNKISVHNVIKEGVVRTFQNVELVWELNILDNLLVAAHSAYRSKFFGHLLHTRLTKREEIIFTKRAMKILEDLKLTPYTYAYPIGLPYGVLKKIELARTLMTNPKMIILDEPAAGLNDAETKELALFIKQIRDEYNLTIFLVEHDMGLVMSICDTVCAISFGKKLAMGTPKDIQKSKVVQEAYLGGD